MEIFNEFAIKHSSQKDVHLLIPHPFASDIHDIIEEFNTSDIGIKNGVVLMDVQTIVGDRFERYITIDVVESKLVRKTKKPYVGLTDELRDFKDIYYSSLDEKITQYVHRDTRG